LKIHEAGSDACHPLSLTILGIANIAPAVIGDEGSTLVVVFNALTLLAFQSSDKNKHENKKNNT
jgi:Cd2+/Zn2+-exporting ATPase